MTHALFLFWDRRNIKLETTALPSQAEQVLCKDDIFNSPKVLNIESAAASNKEALKPKGLHKTREDSALDNTG